MAKQMKLSFEGKDYTLEFTRKTIEQMEKAGFEIGEVSSKPVSNLPKLFAGAFLSKERWVRQDVIDKIYAEIPNKEEFMTKLVEMYAEPLEALFDEPEESEKNAQWEANF